MVQQPHRQVGQVPGRVPTQPRAPAGFTKGEAIDPVVAVLDKVAQRANGAKSAEGAP